MFKEEGIQFPVHLYQASWIKLNVSNTAASKRRIPAKSFLPVFPSLPPLLQQPEPQPRQEAFDDQIRDTIVVCAASFLSFLLFNTLQSGASSCQSGVAIPDRRRDLRRCCSCQAEESCLLCFSPSVFLSSAFPCSVSRLKVPFEPSALYGRWTLLLQIMILSPKKNQTICVLLVWEHKSVL